MTDYSESTLADLEQELIWAEADVRETSFLLSGAQAQLDDCEAEYLQCMNTLGHVKAELDSRMRVARGGQ